MTIFLLLRIGIVLNNLLYTGLYTRFFTLGKICDISMDQRCSWKSLEFNKFRMSCVSSPGVYSSFQRLL